MHLSKLLAGGTCYGEKSYFQIALSSQSHYLLQRVHVRQFASCKPAGEWIAGEINLMVKNINSMTLI